MHITPPRQLSSTVGEIQGRTSHHQAPQTISPSHNARHCTIPTRHMLLLLQLPHFVLLNPDTSSFTARKSASYSKLYPHQGPSSNAGNESIGKASLLPDVYMPQHNSCKPGTMTSESHVVCETVHVLCLKQSCSCVVHCSICSNLEKGKCTLSGSGALCSRRSKEQQLQCN